MTISGNSSTLRPVLGLFAAIFLVLGLAACSNTIEGAGDDMEQMGDDIEEATD